MVVVTTPVGGPAVEIDSWNTSAVGESQEIVDVENERQSNRVVSTRVVEVRGEGVTVRQQHMVMGHPYGFIFLGEPVVAIKRDGDAVDFYTVPSE